MEKPKLLLHICCAPDATVAIERLSLDYAVETYFYNPNIHPREEYEKARISCSCSPGPCSGREG